MRSFEELQNLNYEDMTSDEYAYYVNTMFDSYESEGFAETFNSVSPSTHMYHECEFEITGRVNIGDEYIGHLELPLWTAKMPDGEMLYVSPEEVIPSRIELYNKYVDRTPITIYYNKLIYFVEKDTETSAYSVYIYTNTYDSLTTWGKFYSKSREKCLQEMSKFKTDLTLHNVDNLGEITYYLRTLTDYFYLMNLGEVSDISISSIDMVRNDYLPNCTDFDINYHTTAQQSLIFAACEIRLDKKSNKSVYIPKFYYDVAEVLNHKGNLMFNYNKMSKYRFLNPELMKAKYHSLDEVYEVVDSLTSKSPYHVIKNYHVIKKLSEYKACEDNSYTSKMFGKIVLISNDRVFFCNDKKEVEKCIKEYDLGPDTLIYPKYTNVALEDVENSQEHLIAVTYNNYTDAPEVIISKPENLIKMLNRHDYSNYVYYRYKDSLTPYLYFALFK